MVDSLGWRRKFAVIVPSANTSLQPEYDSMRPRGVTNHFSRMHVADRPVTDDDSFMVLMNNMREATLSAIDAAMTMSPDHVIMGMSAETFWDGADGAERLRHALVERTGGVKVTMGSTAVDAALQLCGQIRRIAVITPYMPVGDEQVRRYFEDKGYEVVRIIGLQSPSPIMIAHESPEKLKRTVEEIDDHSIEAIVQTGTNLAFAKVAAFAEFWLEKPVIAVNTASYWHALRANGIADKVDGFGFLLADH